MIHGIEMQMEFASSKKISTNVSRIEALVIQEQSKPVPIEDRVWKLLAARCNFAQIMQETQMSEGELKKLMIQMKAKTSNPKSSYLQMMNEAMRRYGEDNEFII